MRCGGMAGHLQHQIRADARTIQSDDLDIEDGVPEVGSGSTARISPSIQGQPLPGSRISFEAERASTEEEHVSDAESSASYGR